MNLKNLPNPLRSFIGEDNTKGNSFIVTMLRYSSLYHTSGFPWALFLESRLKIIIFAYYPTYKGVIVS